MKGATIMENGFVEFISNILSAFIGGIFAYFISKREFSNQEKKKMHDAKINAAKLIDLHLLFIDEVINNDIKKAEYAQKDHLEDICDNLMNDFAKLDDHKYEILSSIRYICPDSIQVRNEFLDHFSPVREQFMKF